MTPKAAMARLAGLLFVSGLLAAWLLGQDLTLTSVTPPPFQAVHNITTSGTVTIGSGSCVAFTAGNQIDLLPGFHASAGSAFHAVIATPLSVTPATLAAGTVGTAYSLTLSASGGRAPYTWTISGLAAGLSWNTTTHAISGTPTASSGAATVTVTDSTCQQVSSAGLAVGLTPQTITFNPLFDRTLGTGAFTVAATASSGLTVTFLATPPPVCTISGNTVTLVAQGGCSITAVQVGNANYSATSVTQAFNVTNGPVDVTVSQAAPADGAGSSGIDPTFTFHYTHPLGPAGIVWGQVLINSNLVGPDMTTASCILDWQAYPPNPPVVNTVFLTYPINKNCSLLSSSVKPVAQGWDLTIQVHFDAAYVGLHPIWVRSANNSQVVSPWGAAVGSWYVSSAPADSGSISPDFPVSTNCVGNAHYTMGHKLTRYANGVVAGSIFTSVSDEGPNYWTNTVSYALVTDSNGYEVGSNSGSISSSGEVTASLSVDAGTPQPAGHYGLGGSYVFHNSSCTFRVELGDLGSLIDPYTVEFDNVTAYFDFTASGDPTPVIDSITPNHLVPGVDTIVTITGNNFGLVQGSLAICHSGANYPCSTSDVTVQSYASIPPGTPSWTATRITAVLRATALGNYDVRVISGGSCTGGGGYCAGSGFLSTGGAEPSTPNGPPAGLTVAAATADGLEVTQLTTDSTWGTGPPPSDRQNYTGTEADCATVDSELITFMKSSTRTVKVIALDVEPSTVESQIRWKLLRSTNDDQAFKLIPLPDLTVIPGEVTFQPSAPGNFLLVAYLDTNSDGQLNPGEQLQVLRFAVVQASLVTSQSSFNLMTSFNYTTFPGVTAPLSITAGPTQDVPTTRAMTMTAAVLLEGGGANRTIGTSHAQVGDVGNFVSNSLIVHYSPSGIAIQRPDGNDLYLDFPAESPPTGGETAFRSAQTPSVPIQVALGRELQFTASSAPVTFGWASPLITGNLWNNTTGANAYAEMVVAFSSDFDETYVAVAQARWSVHLVGTGSLGVWNNNGSTVTLDSGLQPTSGNALVQVSGPAFSDVTPVRVQQYDYVP